MSKENVNFESNELEGFEIVGSPPPISPMKNFIAGGFGGMCLVAAGHPFDTIKVRLQTASRVVRTSPSPGTSPLGNTVYTGAFDCFRKTFVNEGILGFYKGMGTPLLMVTPLFALAFFGYGMGKSVMTNLTEKKEPLKGSPARPLTPTYLFCAGAISSCFTVLITTPVERIKCLLQVQTQGSTSSLPPGTQNYKGPLNCATSLVKEGGIKSLYKGFGATFIRGIPQAGLYFMTYDVLKGYLKDSNGGKELTTGKTLIAGGVTGVINWSLVLPLDVIKSRIQADVKGEYPRGTRDVLPKLWKSEGLPGFYRGIVPVFIRAFPANAACFLGFETAIKVMNFVGL